MSKLSSVKYIPAFTAVILAIVCFAYIAPAAADDGSVYGTAIDGYDTVAYHTEGRPIKGSPEHYYDWNDARWYFSSAEHRDLFAADPKRYAPSHAGFCAVSFSAGKFAGMDPLRWEIVDDKLFLGWVKSEDSEDYYRNVEKFLQALMKPEETQ